MKRFVAVLIFGIISISGFAQTADVKWSEVDKDKKQLLTPTICVPYDNGSFFLINNNIKHRGLGIGIGFFTFVIPPSFTPHIAYYNNNMDAQFHKELVINENKDIQYDMIDVANIHGTLKALCSKGSKKGEDKTLFIATLDPSGKVSSAQKELDKHAIESKRESPFYDWYFSDDSSKVMIVSMVPENRKDNIEFDAALYDNQFNLIWKKHIALPYIEKEYDIESIEVTNNGDLLILGKHYEKRDYTMEVIFWNNQGNTRKIIPLDTEDKYIDNVKFIVNKEGNLSCAGFYCDERKRKSIKGYCSFVLDTKSGTMKDSKTQPFGPEILGHFMSEKKAEKGRGLKDLKIRNIYKTDDNGAILVAEVHYSKTFTRSSGSFTTTYTEYYYEDVLVLKFDNNGKLVWDSYINKDQMQENTNLFLGINSFYSHGKLFILYNDNPKNMEKDIDDPDFRREFKDMVRIKKATGVLMTIDEKGKRTRSQVLDGKEEDVILDPAMATQVKNDEVILYARTFFLKQEKLGKLKLH